MHSFSIGIHTNKLLTKKGGTDRDIYGSEQAGCACQTDRNANVPSLSVESYIKVSVVSGAAWQVLTLSTFGILTDIDIKYGVFQAFPHHTFGRFEYRYTGVRIFISSPSSRLNICVFQADCFFSSTVCPQSIGRPSIKHGYREVEKLPVIAPMRLYLLIC